MTLPFNEKIINDNKINTYSFKYPNFAGFLNAYGIPINFDDKFGYTGHEAESSIQERFRIFYILKIKDSKWISQLEKYVMSPKYLRSEKEKYIEHLKECSNSLKYELKTWKENNLPYFPNEQMTLDIYKFLINCYSADTFFDGVGNIEECMCRQEFYMTEYKNKDLYDIDDWDFNIEYEMYKDTILMNVFKNVMVQYLGYHSVERTPRTITTSTFNIYETFYNYLLNDFTIFQIPKMIFDSYEKKYIMQRYNEFYLPDSELRLKDEIESIKKLVKVEERAKYYR